MTDEFLQSSVSHDPSEIILIWRFWCSIIIIGTQLSIMILIITNDKNSFAA